MKKRKLFFLVLLLSSSCLVSCSPGPEKSLVANNKDSSTAQHPPDAKAGATDWRSALKQSDKLLKDAHYQQVLDLLSPFLGGSVDPSVEKKIAQRLAKAHFALGDYEKAEESAKQDDSNLDNNMLAARACYEQGEYAWAISLANAAFPSTKENSEPQTPRKSIPLGDLNGALVVSFQAKCYPGFDPEMYNEGLYVARQCLSTVQRKVTAKDARLADAVENLAAVLTAGAEPSQANYNGSEKLLRQALEIRKEIAGARGLARAETLRELGLVLEASGKVGAATMCYKEALSIDSKILPAKCATVTNDWRLIADATKPVNGPNVCADATKTAAGANLIAEATKIAKGSNLFAESAKTTKELSKVTIPMTEETQDASTDASASDDTPTVREDESLPYLLSSSKTDPSLCALEPKAGAGEIRVINSDRVLCLEGLKNGVVIWRHEIPDLEISNDEISISVGKGKLTVAIDDPSGRGSGRQETAYFWDGKKLKLDAAGSHPAEDPIDSGLQQLVSDVADGTCTASDADETLTRPSSIGSDLLESAIRQGHNAAMELYREGKIAEAANRLAQVFELTARLAVLGNTDLEGDKPDSLEGWLTAWHENQLAGKDYIAALNNYGYFLYRCGKNEEAKAVFLEVINEDPERSVVYLNLGDALWAAKRLPEARVYYHMYLEQMHARSKDRSIPPTVLKRVG